MVDKFKIMNILKDKKIRNPIAILAAFICLLTLFFPWWSITIGDGTISVYPYIIHNPDQPIGLVDEPAQTYRMVAFTIIIIINFVLISVGSFLKGILAKASIGIGSLSMLGVVFLFKGAIQENLDKVAKGEYVSPDAPGRIVLEPEGFQVFLGRFIETSYELGLYLAIIAALLGIISIFLYDVLITKYKK